MSSVVKDNQVLASIPDAKTSSPSAGSSTLSSSKVSSETSSRPQPVALEVAVTVNGARTVAGSDKREPFSESTKTVLIFGNGAVVRLVSTVAPGQLLFLTNEKTKKEVVCQVVKSKNYSNVSGYVELEFTEPVAGFWGMRFPAAASTPHTAMPNQTAGATKTSAETSPVSTRPAATQVPSPAFPESISASSSLPQPSSNVPPPVSPAAGREIFSAPAHSVSSPGSSHPIHSYSSNSSPASPIAAGSGKPSNVVDISKPKISKVESPVSGAKSSGSSSKSILDSDEVKIPSWLEPLARNAASSAPLPEVAVKEQLHSADAVEADDLSLTEISDTPEVAAHPVAAPTFGTHFLTEEDVISAADARGGSSKKVLIGAIAAGLLLAAGGGAWYLRQQKTDIAVTTSAAASGTVDSANVAQGQPQAQAGSSPSGNYTAVSSPASNGGGVSTGLTTSSPVDSSPAALNANKKLATVDSPLAAAVAQPKKPKLGEVNLSTPVASKPAMKQDGSEEALNLGSSTVADNAGLTSGLVASSRQPVAPPAPLPVGGDVKAAKLISSVAPIYPAMARSQRVGGDVKIDALVDINGQVAGMTVISGPVLLQQPAMDAVRRWKYVPAQLNGKAVPMHLTVTVQFKIQ